MTWDAASKTALLDPAANLAFATVYTVTVRGGAGGVTDVAGNAMAADVSWSFTTQPDPNPPPDTTPPTVIGTTPTAGATGVAPTANVTVTFNEPMNGNTVNGANVQLRDAAAQLVAATVT